MNDRINAFLSNLENSNHSEKDRLYELAHQVFNDNEYIFTSTLQQTNEGFQYLVISGAIILNNNNRQAFVRLEFQKSLNEQIMVYLVNPDKNGLLLNSAYTQNGNGNLQQYKLNYPKNLNFMKMLEFFKEKFNTNYPYVAKPKPKDQTKEIVDQNIKYIAKEMIQDIKEQISVQKSIIQCYQDQEQECRQWNRIKQDIERQSEVLEQCTSQLENFLKEQQETPINSENIEEVIVSTQDSLQVTELSVQLKCYKDAYKYLQIYFITNNGEYEYMYQNVKKLADKEFDAYQLLQKCLKKW